MQHEAAADVQPQPKNRRRWYALLILSLSLMLTIIDGTVVNVAIPTIREEFGASLADVEWMNSIYSLVFAATLITWGKVGDVFGRRLLFLIGLVIFGIASVLVGASPTIDVLIIMRALQGIGASMLSPSTLSLITTSFKGKERGIAFGVWGATAGVAAALGPLLGGWVIDNASWRWAFYINLPLVVAAFIGSLWAIRESRDENASRQFDLIGTVLVGLGLGGVIFGLIEGQTYGWWEPTKKFVVAGIEWPLENISIVPFSIIAGATILILFVLWEQRLERRGKDPLFEFGLLRFPSFRYGLFTAGIVSLGEFGLIFSLSIFFQGVKGLSAFETGVAFLPFAGAALVAAPLAGLLTDRIGPKWVVTSGMIIETIALFWLSQLIGVEGEVGLLVPPLLMYGAGLGLAIAQLTNVVLFDVPQDKAGVGSGANSTIRQIGSALGIAIIGAVLATTIGTSARTGMMESELLDSNPVFRQLRNETIKSLDDPEFDQQAFSEGGGGAAPPAFAEEMMGGEDGEGGIMAQFGAAAGQMFEQFGAEIGRIFTEASAKAAANAALAAFIFVGLGGMSSLLIPNRRADEPAPEEVRIAAH